MEKIYEQAKDLHVKSYVVYNSVQTLYEDEDLTIPADLEKLKDAFFKGLLLVSNQNEYVRITSFSFLEEDDQTTAWFVGLDFEGEPFRAVWTNGEKLISDDSGDESGSGGK